MKKKILIIGTVVIALLGTSTIIAAQSPSNISRDQAKKIALKEVNGLVEEVELEKERGTYIYEVEVQKPSSDDDTTVKIDAKTGKVLAVYEDDENFNHAQSQRNVSAAKGKENEKAAQQPVSKEATVKQTDEIVQENEQQAVNKAQPVNKSTSSNSSQQQKQSASSQIEAKNNNTNKSAMLTKEQAKKIAVEAVGGKVVEIERDKDDGFVVYEVEVKTNKGEYELDIDAYSGKIIKKEFDRYDDDDDRDNDDDDYDYDDDDGRDDEDRD